MAFGVTRYDGIATLACLHEILPVTTKPADLPVVQMSKLELVINAETTRMLDLAVRPRAARARDEVIE